MKKSIFLTKVLFRIISEKLKQEGIAYDNKQHENGVTLYIENEYIQKCSTILELARKEEREISEVLYSLSCEIVNKELFDLENIPHETLVGDLAVVPIKQDGSIIDVSVCKTLYQESNELLHEAITHLKNESFVLEKMNVLLEQIMKNQELMDSYIEETMSFHNAKNCPVWVLHNYPKTNGTAALCANWLMEIIHANLEENYYILPTSKQESLIFPESQVNSLIALQELYAEISEDELRLDDALSKQILYFDGINLIEAPELPERADVNINAYVELCSIFLRLRGC